MDLRLDKVDQRLDQMDLRLDKVEESTGQINLRLARLEEDVEIIKEDAKITRSATNTLLGWAEKAGVQVSIPLYTREDSAS